MRIVDAEAPELRARDFDLGPHLSTRTLGRMLEVHAEIESTNARALELARAGAAHGTTVVAVTQTGGRGQRGKRWFSPPGAGLYASFVLRPELPPRRSQSPGQNVCRRPCRGENVRKSWGGVLAGAPSAQTCVFAPRQRQRRNS